MLSIIHVDVGGIVDSVIVIGIEPDSDIPVVAGTKVRVLDSCNVVVPLIPGFIITYLHTSYFVDD